MVCLNVPQLGGQRKPSLALPLLYSAHDELQRGNVFAAAAKCRIAVCRYLLCLCEYHACTPRRRATPERMIRALDKAGCDACLEYLAEIIGACDAALRCEKPEPSIACCVEIAADLIDASLDGRGGEA